MILNILPKIIGSVDFSVSASRSSGYPSSQLLTPAAVPVWGGGGGAETMDDGVVTPLQKLLLFIRCQILDARNGCCCPGSWSLFSDFPFFDWTVRGTKRGDWG